MTATAFSTLGISVALWRPAFSVDESTSPYTVTYTPKSAVFLDGLQERITAYSHVKSATRGYDSASFSFGTNVPEVEQWVAHGLGLHVEVADEAASVCWEGYIDSMAIQLGALTLTRGPLSNVANRTRLAYSYIEPGTNVANQERRFTAIAEDAASQRRFGVCWQILSAGGMTDTEADAIRDLFLSENKDARGTQQVALGGAGNAQITVSCRGYAAKLTYPYNSRTTGQQNLSTKLAAILDADPNGLFSSQDITANTLQVDAWEDDSKEAIGLINDLVTRGDAAGQRYTFGVYAGRHVRYEAAPTDVAYTLSLAEPDEDIHAISGERISPWRIDPGKRLLVTSLLAGKSTPADLREDERCLFLERVQYTAPYQLMLQSGSTDTLPQTMARFGLAGIGAG